VRPVGELPVKSMQVHLLTLPPLRLRGMLSAATTVNRCPKPVESGDVVES